MNIANDNLYASFQRVFLARGDAPVLTIPDGACWTYMDLERESARFAGFLTDLGVPAGQRVSVQVEKSPQAVCLYLACLRAGLVYHPLNTAYREQELAFFLGNAEPAVVVCDPSKLELMQRLSGDAHLYSLDASGAGTLTEAALAAPAEFETVISQPGDLACLLYSSGTTGTPKGIMINHGNLLGNSQQLVRSWGFTETDVLLHALPIYHIHGLFMALHSVFLSGASMAWLPAFNEDAVLEALPDCTAMMGVPTYYVRLLADGRLTRKHAQHMRLFLSGSAALLTETFNAFEACTGHRILERFGMTETGVNASNPLSGERKPGTVGPPLPGVQLRIVDAQEAILGHNQVGRVQVQGPNVFAGYWRLPEKTAEDFTADGFFDTGDQGLIDEDGYVHIVGRAKDMVITGGLNVYPREVEMLIDVLPNVNESAVIGVPHSDFGEAVVAVVVAEGSTNTEAGDELITALRDQVAGFKVPKRVMFVDELPRNGMGKVQKNRLREEYADLFSARAESQ